MEVAISVRQVSKKFRLFKSAKERMLEALHPFGKPRHQEFWALRDISFDVGRGEIVGILGKNGSGKSTLLQIICAVMRATHGTVEVQGRISALLELGAGFNPEFTGRENVLLNGSIMGFSQQAMQNKMPEIEAFADIGDFFDQPVKTYSSGMFVRVAFAAAIHIDPEILVVDEALSVGDSKFQHRCFQRIREFMEAGKTILVVSHSTDTLLRICHRGIVIDQGRLSYAGPIKLAVNHYQDLLFGTRKPVPDNLVQDWQPQALAQPIPAIQALAPTLHDRVCEHPYYHKHETRIGNGAATIIDFDLIANGKLNPPEIPLHAEIELIAKLRFNEDIDGVFVGFALVTIDGTYVFGTNLAMMNQPFLAGQKGCCMAVKFRFTSHLAGGEYFLNIGSNQLASGEDRYLDVRRSVARLAFAGTHGQCGFINLDVKHEVVTLAAGRAKVSFA
ncbi:ABC transporter ATP-binding protein [Chitinivorax sp. B]|uniref:ABC transporter ATP-binding protein n=1 Tax=Chitinivorax sp. B TaxID=2502235 RepID=UPI0010F57F1A|nr:ABC transporter ATP-binding protein [Chitinivorax sp. B]